MPAHVRADSKPVRRHGPVSTVVGIVGELLITAGVILGLFVVWQLWWTDIEANKAHAQTVAELNQTFKQPANPTVAAPQNSPETAPVMAKPQFATPFATLYVPRFGADYDEPISEGSLDQTVNKKEVLDVLGISHYPDTQMPGEMGNFAIAGHRTTYGKPFSDIAELQPEDAIVVRTADAWYVYQMTSNEIVRPQDYQVVYPIPGTTPTTTPDNRYITMTACHPKFSATQRFVVHGTLKYWAPANSGVPQELIDAGVQISAAGTGTNDGGR